MPTNIQIAATVCFVLAVLHTFSVRKLQHIANKFPDGSPQENLFHLLGEVEIVFGFWSAIYLIILIFSEGSSSTIGYLETLNFTEPAFVFVIMTVCSTKPILNIANVVIEFISKLIPLKPSLSFFISCLIFGPLLGSFITEPAAMTVTALILLKRFYKQGISFKLKYATLGVLFVNISIGGTLTHFAAPPVLMVASKWGWDTPFMLEHFGWRAIIVVIVTTLITAFRFRKELSSMNWSTDKNQNQKIPTWVTAIHLIFLAGVIIMAHHMIAFVGLFLFFLGLYNVTQEFHDRLNLREPLLVAFFLGGLVVIGAPQHWWLQPLLESMNEITLYIGAISLTAITDNAALTYLGSQVSSLSEVSKYALVAGSVVGGGLTVIANAPNPAGYGILNGEFGPDGIGAKGLFTSALFPTIFAGIMFWLFQ